MVPKSNSALHRLLERSQDFRLSSLWEDYNSRSTETALTKSDIDSEEIYHSSDKSTDQFVAAIILFLGVAMLIAPLWILRFVQGLMHRPRYYHGVHSAVPDLVIRDNSRETI